jgi:hypothetical protein
MPETGTSGLMSGDKTRDDALASAPALVLDSTTQQTDGYLFASGHSKIGRGHLLTVWFDRGILLSFSIRGLRFVLDWQKSCCGGTNRTEGVIVSPWYRPAHRGNVVRAGAQT